MKKENLHITKEQIIELIELNESLRSLCVKQKLKEWFPQFFEEKEKGYYKHKDNSLEDWFCYIDFEKETYYGYNGDYEFSGKRDSMIGYIKVNCREMNVYEIGKCLEKEAIRRGFVRETYFYPIGNKNLVRIISEEIYHYDQLTNKLMLNDRCIFDNGIWAKKIKTITLKEAEEKLNRKIINS